MKKKVEREAEYIASREFDKEARYYFGQIKDVLNLIKEKQLPDERFSDDEVCLFEEICHALNINITEQIVEVKYINNDGQEKVQTVSTSWFDRRKYSAVEKFVESLDDDEWTYVPVHLVDPFLTLAKIVVYARKARL